VIEVSISLLLAYSSDGTQEAVVHGHQWAEADELSDEDNEPFGEIPRGRRNSKSCRMSLEEYTRIYIQSASAREDGYQKRNLSNSSITSRLSSTSASLSGPRYPHRLGSMAEAMIRCGGVL